MQNKIILGAAVLAFAFAPAAKKLKLEFNLEEGKIYHQKIESSTSTTQTVQGIDQVAKQEITSELAIKVKDRGTGENTYTLNYENLAVVFEQGPSKQSFTSDTSSLESVDPMSRIFSAMTDEDFDAVINYKGEVQRFSGLQEVINNATAGLGAEGQNLTAQLSESFGDAGMKQSIESLTAIIPAEPVKPGSTWNKKQTAGMSTPMILDNTYTLKDISDGVATIEVNGKASVAPDNAHIEVQGMAATIYLDGTHTGTIRMDVNTGWVESATLTDDVAGSITLDPNAEMPEGMTVPLQIKTVTNVSSR